MEIILQQQLRNYLVLLVSFSHALEGKQCFPLFHVHEKKKNYDKRRTMTRLTLLYKMSRGEIDIDTDSFLRPHAESRTRASHSYRYRQDIATKNLYFYSFFPRTLRQWNNLPADIVESNSLSQFQSKLSDHLSHV